MKETALSASTQAIDEHALEQVACLLDDELVIAIDEYLEDAAAYIRDIKKGLESMDCEEIARASHPLKSNSKSFGLTAVAKYAEEINICGRSNELRRVPMLLSNLQRSFEDAEVRLHEFAKYIKLSKSP